MHALATVVARHVLAAGTLFVIGCQTERRTVAPQASGAGGVARQPNRSDAMRLADAYYLGTCAACSGMLGAKGETINALWDGRDLRFCSAVCRDAFFDDAARSGAHLDHVMIQDQLPLYPLKTSIVSGKLLGPSPTDFVWGNRLFRVTAPDERDMVLADPARYIRLLDRAVIDAQEASYGMPQKCPVQGDILPSDHPVDIVVANRMIRVCCGRCVRVVKARPSQYLGMVEYANRQAAERRESEKKEVP